MKETAIGEVCGGMFNVHLTANLLRNLPVKKIVNRLRFDRIIVMSRLSHFLAHPVQMFTPACEVF